MCIRAGPERPSRDAASNTAARVSLPLTMSNIRGQKAKNTKVLARPSAASVLGSKKPPRLRRGGDIGPAFFPVNRLSAPNPQGHFVPFFWPKMLHLRTHGWIRKAKLRSAGGGVYTPVTSRWQACFSTKCVKGTLRDFRFAGRIRTHLARRASACVSRLLAP